MTRDNIEFVQQEHVSWRLESWRQIAGNDGRHHLKTHQVADVKLLVVGQERVHWRCMSATALSSLWLVLQTRRETQNELYLARQSADVRTSTA